MGLDMWIYKHGHHVHDEVSGESYREQDIEIGYWRKFNALHAYILDLTNSTSDSNCEEIDLSEEDVNNILDTLNQVRLILEKGTKADEEVFKSIIYKISHQYSNLVFSAIKKNWKVLYNKDLILMDYTYIPFYSNLSFCQNIKRMNWFSTIKKWARKHNPVITQDMKDDINVVYFMDYV